MSLRVVIVDDEPLAREKLIRLLDDEPDVTVVGVCGNGRDAVDCIRRERPDLVFLDVQMPEVDGFSVLDALDPGRAPAVVFITAYDRYAIRAFEVHALDYLLKPFDRDRFRRSLAHVRDVMARDPGGLEASVRALVADLRLRGGGEKRLLVRSGGRVSFVETDAIDWIQAAGNYVELRTGPERHLMRETLKNLVARLDPGRFVRIHRSIVVNMDRVKHIESALHGDYILTLHDGRKLQSGRGFSEALRERLDAAR